MFRLAFGGNLTDQDVSGEHACADPYNAAFIQVPQGVLPDIGDFPCDFLWSQFCGPGVNFQLFNVNAGIDIIMDEPLANEDSILKVVAFPRHERHQYISTKRKLATLGCGPIGNDLPAFHLIARADNGTMVKTGVLVAPEILNHRMLE